VFFADCCCCPGAGCAGGVCGFGLCAILCFGFGFVVAGGVVVVSVPLVAGAVSGGVVVVAGGFSGSVGFGSGAVIVGAVAAGGIFGFFFLHADENVVATANSTMAVARSNFMVC
jgi:hypothetical protein